MALATHDKKEYQLLLETIEAQKRIINAQKNELQWFHDVISNPSFNEVDIRSLVTLTPREMRMGYSDEAPEKKLFLPDLEEKIHASGKTFVKRMKRIEKLSGAVKYDFRPDESGNNRSYLQILPAIARPSEIKLEKATRGGGGEYDENGKRIKRCHNPQCGSDNLTLVKKSHIVCEDCGEVQPGSRKETRTPVNPPETSDLEASGHGDSRDFEATSEEMEPSGHGDMRTSELVGDDQKSCGHGDSRDFAEGENLETEACGHGDSRTSEQEQEGPAEPEPEPENEACGHGDMRDAASDTEGQKASGHGDCRTSDLDSTPDIKACGHGDSRDSAENEIPKLPHYTESTGGVNTESSNVPGELLKRRQWVVWCYEPNPSGGKPKKVPHGAFGKCTEIDHTNPANWRTYEEAVKFYRESHEQRWNKPLDGIGFALADGVVGVDIDHCISEDGRFSDLAADVMNTLFSYSELSPSATGVHILVLGEWPGEWKRRDDIGLEVYSEKHYFTFTGQHILGTPGDIEERTTPLAAVHAKYAPPEAIARPIENTCGHTSSNLALVSTDEILLRARNAANGAKFTRLYDDGDITGYTSPSNADLALCNLLAYWTDDADVIDALFRKSALYREEKWDRAARIGETYGEGTIRVALEARNAA